MRTDKMNELKMKLNSAAPCYVFTLQARARDVAGDGSRYRAESEDPRPLDASDPTGSGNTDASGSSQPSAATSPLTLAQVETARNAAVAVLNAIGIDVDSTSSVLNVPAQTEPSRLILNGYVETLASVEEELDAVAEEPTSAPALDPGIRLNARNDA